MRRRHFRRLPRYRLYHGSLPSPFFVLRNKKKKKFSLSTLFSPLSANRRRVSLVTPFVRNFLHHRLVPPPFREKHCESRSKDNIKRIQRKELESRIYNFHYRRERFLFYFFFLFRERLGTVYEFSTGILSVDPRIGYARTERRNRWRGGKIKKACLVLSPWIPASCSSKLPRGATPNLFQTLYHERLTVSFSTLFVRLRVNSFLYFFPSAPPVGFTELRIFFSLSLLFYIYTVE